MNNTITRTLAFDQDQHNTRDGLDRVRLTLADRLSVRLGLWLLLRAERRTAAVRTTAREVNERLRARERADRARQRAASRVWQTGLHIV